MKGAPGSGRQESAVNLGAEPGAVHSWAGGGVAGGARHTGEEGRGGRNENAAAIALGCLVILGAVRWCLLK